MYLADDFKSPAKYLHNSETIKSNQLGTKNKRPAFQSVRNTF